MKHIIPLALILSCLAPSLTEAAKSAHKWPNQSWRNVVDGVVAGRLPDFERAADKEEFCPGYQQADPAARVNCWSTLVRAVVRLESNDKPGTVYYEPMGYNSVGLLQLSRNECKNAPTEAMLKNAEANLICGTHKMANLIRSGARIEGKKGAGKYWSVLRKPYRYGNMQLGKVTQIQAITRNYRDHEPSNLQGGVPPALADNPARSGLSIPEPPAPAPAKPELVTVEERDDPPPARKTKTAEKPTVQRAGTRQPANTRQKPGRDQNEWNNNFWSDLSERGQ